jgi:hypothetical protein
MYEFISTHHHITFSRSSLILIVILAVWEVVWKLIALWKASRNNQLAWFIVMAIINTAGILEIVYILFFQKKSANNEPE